MKKTSLHWDERVLDPVLDAGDDKKGIGKYMKCRKILLVEDDCRLRQMVKDILELSGIEVETTNNGRETLDYLNQHPAPALMLLDLMMPVMSGSELLDKLNEDGRLNDFPIVLVSTLANDEEWNSYRLPALMKPVNLQTLLDLGKKYCNADLDE